MNRSRLHATRRVAAALAGLSAALLLVACGASPRVDPVAEARHWEYREQLILAAQAINAADLEQAKVHVEQARSRALNTEQTRKVESLALLIAGAEALRDGDVPRARRQWAQIEDPALMREVRVKARRIGIEIPGPGAVVAEKER